MKDSYWFKHDSNASRDMKLIRIRAIYDFWGLGLYWTVIEFLREQDDYKFPSDESSLQIACNSVFCSDLIRFNNWFKDCLKFGLFKDEEGFFFSESLIDRMKLWESKKNNGQRGGRPPKEEHQEITESETETLTESETEIKANTKASENHKIIEDNIRKEYNSFISLFNSITGKNCRGTKKDFAQFKARLKEGYSVEDFAVAIENCKKDKYHIENPQYLDPEFITRADKLQRYTNVGPVKIYTQPTQPKKGNVENPNWHDNW
jgi:uncharacterized phage protein (TIGR02220 family)